MISWAKNTARGVRILLRFNMYLFLAQCEQVYLFLALSPQYTWSIILDRMIRIRGGYVFRYFFGVGGEIQVWSAPRYWHQITQTTTGWRKHEFTVQHIHTMHYNAAFTPLGYCCTWYVGKAVTAVLQYRHSDTVIRVADSSWERFTAYVSSGVHNMLSTRLDRQQRENYRGVPRKK